MVQHISSSIFNGRTIQAALYIGNLLAAVGQTIGGQFYLTARTAILGRNGNALAVDNSSSTSRIVFKSSAGHVGQRLAQANGNSLAGGSICRGGQIAVSCLELDSTAQILLHHRACIVTESEAATSFLAIYNGIGHLLELVFRSRPAADDGIGVPVGILEPCNVESCAAVGSASRLAADIDAAGIRVSTSTFGTTNADRCEVDIRCSGNLDILDIIAAGKGNIIPCHKVQGIVSGRDSLDIRAVNLSFPAGIHGIGHRLQLVLCSSPATDGSAIPSGIGQSCQISVGAIIS